MDGLSVDIQTTVIRQLIGCRSSVAQWLPDALAYLLVRQSRYHPSAVCYYRGDSIFVLYVKKVVSLNVIGAFLSLREVTTPHERYTTSIKDQTIPL